MEGYLEFLIAGILQTRSLPKIGSIFTNFSDSLSFVAGMFFYITVMVFPLIVNYIIGIKMQVEELRVEIFTAEGSSKPDVGLDWFLRDKEKSFDRKWAVFYDGINTW
jgi:hypothetical protein